MRPLSSPIDAPMLHSIVIGAERLQAQLAAGALALEQQVLVVEVGAAAVDVAVVEDVRLDLADDRGERDVLELVHRAAAQVVVLAADLLRTVEVHLVVVAGIEADAVGIGDVALLVAVINRAPRCSDEPGRHADAHAGLFIAVAVREVPGQVVARRQARLQACGLVVVVIAAADRIDVLDPAVRILDLAGSAQREDVVDHGNVGDGMRATRVVAAVVETDFAVPLVVRASW